MYLHILVASGSFVTVGTLVRVLMTGVSEVFLANLGSGDNHVLSISRGWSTIVSAVVFIFPSSRESLRHQGLLAGCLGVEKEIVVVQGGSFQPL